MSDEVHLQGRTAIQDIGVNFPFVLYLEHGPIDFKGMFELTHAFDMYEMEKDSTDQEGLVKENILVDVLETSPHHTVIKVTPAATMPYASLARHTQAMVELLGKRIFKGKPKIAKLVWEIDKTGVASDLRGMLRKVS